MNAPVNKAEIQTASATTIYVVDDEPMLLELAFAILAPHGYRVRTFRDPQAALAAFERESPPPALVVTDYAMAGMNGLQLLEGCRRLRPAQKFLMVSGSVNAAPYLVSPAPFDNFLAKPYHARHLVDVVAKLLK